MSIEKKDIIDYITEENGKKVLSISDHLQWDDSTVAINYRDILIKKLTISYLQAIFDLLFLLILNNFAS